MNRPAFAAALVLASALAIPVAAQTLDLLLPTISFPDTDTTSSTKGCVDDAASPVCALPD